MCFHLYGKTNTVVPSYLPAQLLGASPCQALTPQKILAESKIDLSCMALVQRPIPSPYPEPDQHLPLTENPLAPPSLLPAGLPNGAWAASRIGNRLSSVVQGQRPFSNCTSGNKKKL